MATQQIDHLTQRRCHGGNARLEAEQRWFGGGVHAATRRWIGAEAEIAYTCGMHSLILTLDGGTELTGSRVADEQIYEGADRPGVLTFVPSDVDRVGWYRGADMRFIGLYLDPALNDRLPAVAKAADAPVQINGSDVIVEGALRALAQEMGAGIRHDALLIEHMVSMIAHRLDTHHSAPSDPPRAGARLSGRQLNRITEYIETHLADEISLKDLATIVHMSNDGFSRAFKKTTGDTPYQFLLSRRVRRAEALLAETDDGIASVAYTTGFSSQSHLTTTFRRINGWTPHAFRRAHRL